MGYNHPNYIVLQLVCAAGNENDSTSYYLGDNNAASLATDATRVRIPIPCAGTVRKVLLRWYSSVDCTTENTTISFYLNGATATSLYVGSFANAASPLTKAGLGIAVSEGDYFTIKIDTPAWVTNPQSTSMIGTVLIETA